MRAYMAFCFGGASLLLGLVLLSLGNTVGYIIAGLIILGGAYGLLRGWMAINNKQPLIVFHKQGIEPRGWPKDLPLMIPWADIESCEAYLAPGDNSADYLAIKLYPDARKRLKPSPKMQRRFQTLRERYNIQHDLLIDSTQFATSLSEAVKEAEKRVKAAQAKARAELT